MKAGQNKRRQFTPLFTSDDTTDEEFFGTAKTTEKYRDNFYSMCRDGPSSWRNATVDVALRCRTVHFNDPYLKLGPFTMEEKSDRPFLVVFYNFLSAKESKVRRVSPHVNGKHAKYNLDKSPAGHCHSTAAQDIHTKNQTGNFQQRKKNSTM